MIKQSKGNLTIWAKAVKQIHTQCQVNVKGSKCKGHLHAHHIVYKSVDPSKAFDLNNGMTLCAKHHYELHIEEATTPEDKAFYQDLLDKVQPKPKPRPKTKPKPKPKKKKIYAKKKKAAGKGWKSSPWWKDGNAKRNTVGRTNATT